MIRFVLSIFRHTSGCLVFIVISIVGLALSHIAPFLNGKLIDLPARGPRGQAPLCSCTRGASPSPSSAGVPLHHEEVIPVRPRRLCNAEPPERLEEGGLVPGDLTIL